MSATDRFKRKTGRLEPFKVILIVCEGKRTEPDYFESFRLPKNVIDVQGAGSNTDSLMKEAIRYKEEANYSEVWCVFDRDSFPPENIARAFQLANENGIKVAFSNECFELWYLLHYQYLDTGVTRAQYSRMLSQQMGRKYKKNDPTMYDLLLTKQSDAIRNARRLLKEFPLQDGKEHEAKPSTSVVDLVERLNKLVGRYQNRKR